MECDSHMALSLLAFHNRQYSERQRISVLSTDKCLPVILGGCSRGVASSGGFNPENP